MSIGTTIFTQTGKKITFERTQHSFPLSIHSTDLFLYLIKCLYVPSVCVCVCVCVCVTHRKVVQVGVI